MLAPIGRDERRGVPTGVVATPTRLRAHATAPLRGVALAALGVAGLLAVLPAVVAVALGMVGVLESVRRLPCLRRELAGRWSDVPVGDPYLPEPPDPRPRDSGLYRDGRQLYASYDAVVRRRRARQVRRDPATLRDLAWLLLDPLVGVPLAALPAVLVGGGLYGVVVCVGRAVGGAGLPWAAAAAGAGLASVATGLTAGPLVLWVHGCWTRLLLAPRTAPPVWSGGKNGKKRNTLAGRLQLMGAALLLSALALVGSLLAAVQVVALVVSLCTGLVEVFPKAVRFGRRFVALGRRLAADLAGVEIPVPYLDAPKPVERGADGHYRYGRRLYRSPYLVRQLQLTRHTLTDPAVWRDLLWLAAGPAVAVVLLVPPLVAGFALFGLVLPSVLDALMDGAGPYSFWDEVLRQLPPVRQLAGVPWLAVPVGAVLVAAAVWVAPYALGAHARFGRLLLRPTRHAQLARRVQRLTESRADATGVQAAELRRIERDLHDGAQVSLVSIGITLRMVERRLGEDAPELRELVAEARRQSATALAQLRDLVRGIHPPVLAERGVGDAVRAMALDCPLDVEVTVDVPGRPEAPVEACAYFAVCEVLANAAKHSGASRVHIGLWHSDGALRMTVTDDGRGGADLDRGTGLQGVRRRLGTFDGDLFVSSPVGGPTVVTMELPCVLSSPRINSC